MNEELLKQASELAEAGERQAARSLILAVLQDSPNDSSAWEALIELAESDAERRKAIYQFWALEPKNPEANRLLEKAKAGKLPPIDEKAGLSSRNYLPKAPRLSFWQRIRQFLPLLLLLIIFPGHAQEEIPSCPGAPSSRLVVGQQARVIATGGSNLRVIANSGADLLHIIPEGELIPVIDGPYCAESIAWWQVDYDGERGWVAEGMGEFYWLAPYLVQQAQIGTIRLETLPYLAASIEWQRLGEPLRSQFVLEGYPVTSPLIAPFIVIFDESTAAMRQSIHDARTRPATAQFSELESNQFSGIRFVELYYPNRIEESALIYHFMGETVDNRFIDAYFPLFAENLPLPYNANDNYLAANAELIASATAFQPSLESLDLLLLSLRVDAPIEESDLLHYEEAGVRFDYNPILAYGAEQSFVDDTPPYISINLLGMEGESIGIYRSEDMQGSELASFQQSLSRQPTNPPRFPLEDERPESEIVYLDAGLRYLSESQYHYFGLSNGYYLMLQLPSDAPLSVLDAFVESFAVGN